MRRRRLPGRKATASVAEEYYLEYFLPRRLHGCILMHAALIYLLLQVHVL